MSVLLSESLRILREHGWKPLAGSFPPGETRGRFKVLPRTDGWWIAFESGVPNGHGPRGAYTSPGAALLAIEALAAIDAASGRLEAAE